MEDFKKLIGLFLLLSLNFGFAREYSIFSVSQSFPMSDSDKVMKKNFYVNMGTNQGLSKGNIIDVTRTMARTDPYDSDARFEFSIKVGELKIIHVEAEAAIAKFHKYEEDEDQPYLEISDFMVGDGVKVHIK